MKTLVPIVILSGFLGSGKTTLLGRAIQFYKQSGRTPAVIINEIGEVNVDGLFLPEGIAMSELLDGCICCTIRGDLTREIVRLASEDAPDVILVETTGAANPVEMLEAVTDASLLAPVELQTVCAVTDAPHLLEQQRKGKGRTYRLMTEQIRCADIVLLNKTDRLTPEEGRLLEQSVRQWNKAAPVIATVQCAMDMEMLDRRPERMGQTVNVEPVVGGDGNSAGGEMTGLLEENGHSHADRHGAHSAHATHAHVLAYTHYFREPVDSVRFENLFHRLPEGIYRAKGVVSFTDTASRFLFQYAYRQLDLTKLSPEQTMPDVAVFIGEHFRNDELHDMLERLSIGEDDESRI